MESYEQKYKEALERAKKMYVLPTDKWLLESIFPELRESKDERIRKAIESIIRVYGKTQGEWIAGYDMDTLVVHLRNAFASLEKQKEQKSEQSEMEKEYVRTLHSLIADFLRGKQEIDREYYQKIWDWLDNRHIEQKPDIEICPHSIKSKSYSEQKPAEWSEEDKRMIRSILFVLESYVSRNESESSPSLITTHPTYYKEIDWLKSLRPQPRWKPSAGQLYALNRASKNEYLTAKQYDILVSLHEQLKKL